MSQAATLSGMTGFARISGQYENHNWQWEVRSVNGKSLDVRMRLPNEFSDINGDVRKIFTKYFARGNLQLALDLVSSGAESTYVVNEDLFGVLSDFVEKQGGTPDAHKLLQVEGMVISTRSSVSDDEKEALKNAILDSADELANNLKSARDVEGRAVAPVMIGAVEKIEIYVAQAETLAAVKPEAILKRLQTSIAELKGQDLDADRLAQEVAVLAMKADVREELDRLKAHCDQARALLAQGSPIGRKLGFLAQEFHRETNTLCSKSSDIELTQIGLEMKSVIEQFREQAANVE
ncbi:MAG: YicC/YloC family endoribonuclease [Maricaulaceae bacterium]